MKSQILAIYNLKGGVGKSTASVNLAYGLSLLGRKVLVIDLDPQKNLTPYFIKASEHNYTAYDILESPEIINRAVYRTKYKGIDIIKGSSKLSDNCNSGSLVIALNRLSEIRDYDYIVIDCRTSCENLTYNALLASNWIISPVLLDGYCRDNLDDVQRIVTDIQAENPDTKWLVFANRVKNLKGQREIFVDLTQRHDYPIADTCVVDRAAVSNALILRKPLVKHASKSQVTLDFMDLTKEIVRRVEGE